MKIKCVLFIYVLTTNYYVLRGKPVESASITITITWNVIVHQYINSTSIIINILNISTFKIFKNLKQTEKTVNKHTVCFSADDGNFVSEVRICYC